MKKTIGYARVSTTDQTIALQIDALTAAGCSEIFQDRATGSRRDRTGLADALAVLAAGDTLVVWRLDRLGRSVSHLHDVAETLRDRGITLRSLTEAIDTSTASGRLVYSMLASFAEFERNVVHERTRAGIDAARRRGVHLGRKRALTPSKLRSALMLLEHPDMSVSHVARQFGVSRATLYREIQRSSAQ